MRVGESQAGHCQATQMRRRNLRVPAVAAEVTVPEIVRQNDDDVRPIREFTGIGKRTQLRPKQDERETNTDAGGSSAYGGVASEAVKGRIRIVPTARIVTLFVKAGLSRHDVQLLVGKAAIRRIVCASDIHAGFVVDVGFHA